jgi:hypothetical protein
MTDEERECIREAARRYVRERAPTPPMAVLESVARIVLQARTPCRSQAVPEQPGGQTSKGEMLWSFHHAPTKRVIVHRD